MQHRKVNEFSQTTEYLFYFKMADCDFPFQLITFVRMLWSATTIARPSHLASLSTTIPLNKEWYPSSCLPNLDFALW